MLKIKDNVDLKELEKYGIKAKYKLADSDTGESELDYCYSTKYECRWGFLRLRPIKEKTKVLHIYRNKIIDNYIDSPHKRALVGGGTSYIYGGMVVSESTFLDMDLLYDLITAGLVEKVEE